MLKASPFRAEGHRKVKARLAAKGIRVDPGVSGGDPMERLRCFDLFGCCEGGCEGGCEE